MIASAQAYAFIALAVTLLLLGTLALLALGMIRMESTLGIFRDGLRRGTRAPVWRLPDANGRNHATPSERKWQLLIFGDHSLREFGELVSAVKELSASERELEILVLSRADLALTERTLNRLRLDVPIVRVDDRFYHRYNVRVMPFMFVLDPGGVVQAAGLVSTEATLRHMWKTARSSVVSSQAPRPHRWSFSS